ncbi:MAG: hypothetical protein ACXAEX_19265 [Promethearchaeota archaeon]|jgi:hypothetical protein
MEDKKWILLCVIGGTLMILGSTIGNINFFETVYGMLVGTLSETWLDIIRYGLNILAFIAAGGGVSVIVGAVIVGFGMYRLGKIIIALGAGLGLIGFIIFITGSIINGSIVNDLNAIIFEIINGGYGFLGVLLTIVARTFMKEDDTE